MNNLNGNRKNEFRRKQEEKQRKLALKIKDEAGELREGSLKSEEAIPSLDELCAMGERVEQQTTFSAKEAIRNKIKARRDAERYKTTSTDSEKWTPNPFEDSNAAAIESPKNEDILNTTRKHADAQSTKSAGLKTSKRRSIVEMVQKLKKYVPIVVCGDVLYYYNGYYYEAIGLEKLIKLYRKYVELGRGWQNRITDEISRCEQAASLVGHLAQDIATAAGDKNGNASAPARSQFYFAVDQPFRQWLRSIDPEEDDMTETTARWQVIARGIAEQLGQQMVLEAGSAALVGHWVEIKTGRKKEDKKKILYTAPAAYNSFLGRLYGLYPKTNDEGETA